MRSDERAEKLLGQLHRFHRPLVQLPRENREAFIADIAAKYYDDAISNGHSASKAEDWREHIREWVSALVEVIETSGGASGGHA